MKEWTKDDVNTLCRLWHQGASTRYIAEALDTSNASVKMYVQRHRKELGLERRQSRPVKRKRSTRPEFDNQWYGHVPFGHWLITKQWRTTSE